MADVIAAGAVVLVTAVDWAYNRAAGQDLPVWWAPAPYAEEARHG
jgi:hypothetical protein